MAANTARKLNVVTSETTTPKRRTASPNAITKAEKAEKQAHIVMRRRLAIGIGVIAACVIGLSVVHITDSIVMLTGSNMFLSALLAIGIDAGMVASELAEIIAHDDKHVRTWSNRYMVMSIVLSMLLNAYAFSTHAETPMKQGAGVVLGIMIPALVFVLGRIAGYLHNGSK